MAVHGHANLCNLHTSQQCVQLIAFVANVKPAVTIIKALGLFLLTALVETGTKKKLNSKDDVRVTGFEIKAAFD